jgi:dTDP-4-amino-4,6-dideoxygalactose transaminase
MALTNDPQLARRMQMLRSHGITSTLAEMEPRPADEIWNYQQIDLGFNYRMTDIQAVLGLSQFGKIDDFVRRRNEVASRYDKVLGDLPVTVQARSNDAESSFHLYVIRLQLHQVMTTQREVLNQMYAAGVRVNLHYIPVYLQPYFQRLGFQPGYCPEAEAYFKTALSIPVYPGLTAAQQDHVVISLKQILQR